MAVPRPEPGRTIQPVSDAGWRATVPPNPAANIVSSFRWGWATVGLVALLFFGIWLPNCKKKVAEADSRRKDFLKNASFEQIGWSMMSPGQRAHVEAMTGSRAAPDGSATAAASQQHEATSGRGKGSGGTQKPISPPVVQEPVADAPVVLRLDRDDARFPVSLNGRWGYIDAKGKLAVTPVFRDAMDFSEGIAAVKVEDKWGYVDASGKLVVPPEYAGASEFSEGLAAVRKGAGWGYVDRRGNVSIAPRFLTADKFSGGLAAARGPSSTMVGYIGRNGDWAILPRFRHAAPFSGGMAAVWTMDGGDASWGFIGRDGTFAIRPRFTYAFGFSEGLAAVAEGMIRGSTGEPIPGKCCYIDGTGRRVIGPGSDDVTSFSGGLAHVRVNGRQGFIDKSGRWRIPPRFDDAMTFSEGLAPVSIGGKWGYVDERDALAIPCRFDLALPFTNGVGCVIVGEKMGYVDKAGSYVWEPTLVLDSLHAAKFQLIRR